MNEIIGAAIIKDGRILLLHNHGNWSLPGGTRVEDEAELECLSREFSEEFAGTQIDNVRHYKNFEGISPR
ncbi:MAG: NUDIX domain-containing protein, partial [Nanoarchaeota archaeon]